MQPRIHSCLDSRAISPAATLGVAIGNPSFAGMAARTAHSPSANARPEADHAPVASQIDPAGSAGLAPSAPAAEGAAPADAATWGRDAG